MILIINKSRRDARALAEMFRIMGVLAFGTTPSEALSEISNRFSATIIMNPDTLADKEDYASRKRSYANVPIFSISDNSKYEDSLIFDGIINCGSYASRILDYLTNYAENKDIKSPGAYKLARIDASAHLGTPLYFNRALPFTKTETMILRALITAYPTPSVAKEILKYAFRQTRLPEPSNIRTHISVMNKKFREITDRNLITLTPGLGYRILTTEIIEATIK